MALAEAAEAEAEAAAKESAAKGESARQALKAGELQAAAALAEQAEEQAAAARVKRREADSLYAQLQARPSVSSGQPPSNAASTPRSDLATLPRTHRLAPSTPRSEAADASPRSAVSDADLCSDHNPREATLKPVAAPEATSPRPGLLKRFGSHSKRRAQAPASAPEPDASNESVWRL